MGVGDNGPVRRARALTVLLVGVLALATACGTDDDGGEPEAGAAPGNPLAEKAQFRAPTPRLDAAVAQAETDGDTDAARILARLAEVPTGIWLTPERSPAGVVGPEVTGLVQQAGGRSVPVFVVYGIPDRDCTGQLSAGGLDAESYLPWVEEIATAAGNGSVAVLEPDALARRPGVRRRRPAPRPAPPARWRCSTPPASPPTSTPGTPTGARPRRWPTCSTQVGVGDVRGFATNVSNYQPQPLERGLRRAAQRRCSTARTT